jgi:hypothetical protein
MDGLALLHEARERDHGSRNNCAHALARRKLCARLVPGAAPSTSGCWYSAC